VVGCPVAVSIVNVSRGTPAYKAGLRSGMLLMRIDGHEIRDGLDYEFYSSPAAFPVVVMHGDSEITYHIKKQEYEPLGCEFASYLIDKHHSCCNKCVFCFIDQMPKGMRPSLYFKDDDERLSFLFGNYVTLTNLSQREIQRIIEMRIAPVNISVHTANPTLRVEMMKNRHSGEVLRFIPELAAANISMNTQLVLCPGLNDGEELRYTIEWLARYRPAVQSIAAVPVGLTKFRDGLHPLRSYTQAEAAKQLDIMLEYGDRFARQEGLRLVYPSDEWFLLAGRALPPEDFYDGYPQLENGVGMWRLLYDEFTEQLAARKKQPKARRVDLATGTLAAPLFEEFAGMLAKKYPQVSLRVHAVKNDFFGHGVTVAGLLTGGDLMNQLKGRLSSGILLLPEAMLRAEGDVFLDDTTPKQLEEALGIRVIKVPQGGDGLLQAILEG
ncbi:MAG: DUF512 domain-containing protein, partial [Oscillospiraceae bacterium]